MTILAKAEYPFVEWVTKGVADFLLRQRRHRAWSRELDALAPAELSAIARDLKLNKDSLRDLAVQEKGIPHLLVRMLASLKKTMPPSGDLLARDMQTVCSICRSKRRCNRELAAGTAAVNYGKFCPNAFNLDLLSRQEPYAASSYRQPALLQQA